MPGPVTTYAYSLVYVHLGWPGISPKSRLLTQHNQEIAQYRIAQKFRGSKFSRISRIWRHSRNYSNEIFDTCINFLSWTARWLCFSTSKEWTDSIQGLSCRILLSCHICGKYRSWWSEGSRSLIVCLSCTRKFLVDRCIPNVLVDLISTDHRLNVESRHLFQVRCVNSCS